MLLPPYTVIHPPEELDKSRKVCKKSAQTDSVLNNPKTHLAGKGDSTAPAKGPGTNMLISGRTPSSVCQDP